MKNKKRVLVTAAVLVILAGLIYLQVRTWRKFDWQRFWAATGETNKVWLAGGIALIYADYFLRAWRWRVPRGASASAAPSLALAGGSLRSWTRSSTRRLRTRHGRQTEYECGRECDARPNEISSEGHAHSPYVVIPASERVMWRIPEYRLRPE